jgi:hypothetical protein
VTTYLVLEKRLRTYVIEAENEEDAEANYRNAMYNDETVEVTLDEVLGVSDQ